MEIRTTHNLSHLRQRNSTQFLKKNGVQIFPEEKPRTKRGHQRNDTFLSLKSPCLPDEDHDPYRNIFFTTISLKSCQPTHVTIKARFNSQPLLEARYLLNNQNPKAPRILDLET